MTDLHSHLVYGFDDGAGDRDECCRMLELYAKAGVKKVCCTSHSGAQAARGDYFEKFCETSELAQSFGVEAVPALEYSLTDLLADPAVPLGGSRYFLLDTANFPIDSALINKLMPLSAAGKFFLRAHPERLHPGGVLRDAAKCAMLRGSGCQVNAASLLGHYGAAVKEAAWELVTSGNCSVIASDAHNAAGVKAFCQAAEMLKKLYPAESVQRWFTGNPALILANEAPEHPVPVQHSWYQRFKLLFAK